MADIAVKKLTIGNGEDSYTIDTTKFVEMDEHGHVPVETIPSDDRKADKANTILTTTLSRGRKNNTTVGVASFAFGEEVEASFDNAHAEGYYTKASNRNAHAEGSNTIAGNVASHAEGYFTQASGLYSHVEGDSSRAIGNVSHAEGLNTMTNGANSHAEGAGTYTGAANAHAEGQLTTVYGLNGHAEGYNTNASGDNSHAEGYNTKSSGEISHAEGRSTTASALYSHAEGYNTISSGESSHAEGSSTKATSRGAHSEGSSTQALANGAHAEGGYSQASGENSHAEGYNAKAIGGCGHAEGSEARAEGYCSHAEGFYTQAIGNYAHAEGWRGRAEGYYAHAEGYSEGYTIDNQTYTPGAKGSADHSEGYQTIAGTGGNSNLGNHSEGYRTQATGGSSHAEGNSSKATAANSHAEGFETTASGNSSHAEGRVTIAKGYCSHAEGFGTIASASHSHVSGLYNVEDTHANWPYWEPNHSYSIGDKVKTAEVDPETGITTYTGYICEIANSDADFYSYKWSNDTHINFAEIIGNGSSDNLRSNARALDWDGNEYLKGNLYVGCNSDSTGGTRVATLADIARIEPTDLFHICTSEEYNSETGVPTIQNPSPNKFYLVPNQNGASPNLFIEWIYSNNAWESVGSATIDISNKADKTDTVLLTTLSRGRAANTIVGDASVAFGTSVTASGTNSFAIGAGTQALGNYSVTGGGGVTVSGDYSLGFGGGVTVSGDYSLGFGGGTYVSGNTAVGIGSGVHALGLCSAAFGGGSRAYGDYSFVAGGGNIASGYLSTAIGDGLIANGGYSFVHGRFNVEDNSNEYPEWVSDTQYYEDDIVKITMTDPRTGETYCKHYKCIDDNNDHEFTDWNWSPIPNPRTYAEIVGGGSDQDHRLNIRTLDWDGNETIIGKFKGSKLEIGDYAFATGTQSFAIGSGATASGSCAMSKGFGTTASNTCSTALGQGAVASGICSLANGSGVTAAGSNATAFGASCQANGRSSMAVGLGTIANGASQFVFGEQNIPETISDYDNWPTWVANTSYSIGDNVQRTVTTYSNSGSSVYSSTSTYYYECIEANSDSEFIDAKWKKRSQNAGKYLEIVGNGVANTFAGESGSNARALDWDGNEYLMGDVYVGCNSDSTGGRKLISASDYATSSKPGIVQTGSWAGVEMNGQQLRIYRAQESDIKAGTHGYRPITPSYQHISAYYAVSKLAGVDLANGSDTVGVYPDNSKQAIQKLFGFDGIFGDYQNGITASKAYTNGETFVMDGKRYRVTANISDGGLITVGTNCELDPLDGKYVRNTDYATSAKAGVIKIDESAYGLQMSDGGKIRTKKATDSNIKGGGNSFQPIVPDNQHKSAFYGFAKAAGDTTQALSDNPVGQYTDSAKTAILAMLGITLSNAQSAQEIIAAYTNPGVRANASGVSF